MTTKSKLTIENIEGTTTKRALFNNKCVGNLIMDVDGFYYFEQSESIRAYWSAYALRQLATKLNELNKGWSKGLSNTSAI